MRKKVTAVIIILNYNRKNEVLKCLESIFNLDYPDFEITVVDNGSTDGSIEAIKLKYPKIHLVESKKNSGVAGGRNLGINYAEENLDYKYILFLDDDVIVDRRALTEMTASLCPEEKIGIVTPKCYSSGSPGVIAYAGGLSVSLYTGKISDIGSGEKDEGQFDHSGFIPSSGGICLVDRKMFNEIGIFDEKFNPYGWEDVDFSLRAVKKGYKIFYNHKAVVYHKGGKIGRRKGKKDYEFSKTKNYFYLIRKHAGFFQLLCISVCFPFRLMNLLLKEILRGESKTIVAQIGGFFSIFGRKLKTGE
jgi:GT2 family glycosyltransferase